MDENSDFNQIRTTRKLAPNNIIIDSNTTQ